MRRSIQLLPATLAICLESLSALACNIPEITRKIEDANEHQYWSDFWADLDPRESRSEEGYYAFGLRAAREEATKNGCDEHRSAMLLREYIQRKIDTLAKKELALKGR